MSDTWARRTAGENENKTSGLGHHHAQRSPFEFWPVTCHGLSVWDGGGWQPPRLWCKRASANPRPFRDCGVWGCDGRPEDESLCVCAAAGTPLFFWLGLGLCLSCTSQHHGAVSPPPLSSHRTKPPRFKGHLHHRHRPLMCITGMITRNDQAQCKWHKVSPCFRGFCRCHGGLLTRFATGGGAVLVALSALHSLRIGR